MTQEEFTSKSSLIQGTPVLVFYEVDNQVKALAFDFMARNSLANVTVTGNRYSIRFKYAGLASNCRQYILKGLPVNQPQQ